jgi:hypothetical protein
LSAYWCGSVEPSPEFCACAVSSPQIVNWLWPATSSNGSVHDPPSPSVAVNFLVPLCANTPFTPVASVALTVNVSVLWFVYAGGAVPNVRTGDVLSTGSNTPGGGGPPKRSDSSVVSAS